MSAAAPAPPPPPAARPVVLADVDPRDVLREAARLMCDGTPPELLLAGLDARASMALVRQATPDPLLKRTPPHSLEAERNVLSAAIGWPEALDEALAQLPTDAWYSSQHAGLWGVLLRMRGRGAPVDVVTVAAELAEHDAELLERIGGRVGLAELTEVAGHSPANVGYFCRQLEDMATKRRVITRAAKVVADGFEPTITARDLVAKAETELSQAVGRPLYTRATGVDMANELWRAIEAAQRGEIRGGFMTRYVAIDDLTQGLQPGELSAIGARSSMGKTTFALALVARLLEDGHRVGIVSLEMPRLQLARNIAASRAAVDGQRVRSGVFAGDEQDRVLSAVEWLAETGDRLIVDDASPGPAAQVLSRVRSLVVRDRCDVVFLDYLQLVQLEDPRNSHAELGALSGGLKKIVRDVPRAHVLAVCQLNRDVEKRRTHEPMLSDLSGSGQLENDLDLAMLLLRPSYYDRGADPRLLEVHVAKQRNGPTGVAQLAFRRECLRIEDAPPEGFAVPERKKKPRFGRGKKDAPGESQD